MKSNALFLGIVMLALAAPSFAAKKQEPSKDMRIKMADAHEKMAVCLRSEKSMAECRTAMDDMWRQEMKEACPYYKNGKGQGRHKGMMNY